MKNFILFTLFFIIGLAELNAQEQPYEMIVEGVKVIVQPTNNKIVEIRTVFKGGVQNYKDKEQGIESLAMSALTECGTELQDKNSFKDKLDRVSAYINGNVGKDYSTVSLNCLKGDFETVWPLYVEALTKPKFDPKEFERVKQDAVNLLNANESQPDKAIDLYAERIAFAGEKYAMNPDGTPESLKLITPEASKAYYKSIFTKSRILIVVVADLQKAEIENKVKGLINGIAVGEPFVLNKSAFTTSQTKFSAMPKAVATNYIEGITGGPAPGTKEFVAFSVGMRIFSNRHFLEIRTNNGLSYAPHSWFSGGATSSSRIAVSTTDPDKYITVFNALLNKTKSKGFTAEELKDMKTTYLTRYYYGLETNAAQAASLATAEVLQDDWRKSVNLMNDVKTLSLEDVNRVFKTYIGNTSWVYQGDIKKVNPALFTQIATNKAPLPKNKPIKIKKEM